MPTEKIERNLAIAADYNTTSMSKAELCRKYGIGKASMQRILELLESRGQLTRPSRTRKEAV